MAKPGPDTSIEEVEFNFKLNAKQFEALLTPANEIFFGGAKGSGKAQVLTTQVITPNGWKQIKDIHPGDYVYGDDGKPTIVVAESEIITDEDTYEVEFDDGTIETVGARHQWYTQTLKERNSNSRRTPEYRNKRPSRSTGKRPWAPKPNSKRADQYDNRVAGGVRTTEEIFNTLKTEKGNHINHGIPIAKALSYPDADLPIDPYVFGFWAGDGSKSSGQFACIDPPIWEKIEQCGYTVTHSKTNQLVHRILGLTALLKQTGVYQNKHIPVLYKRASYEQRLELLRGVMDSDGTVDTNGYCSLSLSDERLAQDVLDIIVSLGIRCNMRRNKAFLYGVRKKDRFRMNFVTEVPVFSLPRKMDRMKKCRSRVKNFHYITGIRQVERQPLKCIQVSNKSHLYLIGKSLIPTHNSFLARNAAVMYAINIPGIQVYIFRRTFSEVKGNFLYGDAGLSAVLSEAEKAGVCSINSAEPRIHFKNGSDIYLRHMQTPQDVEQIRGRDVHVLICDEATQWMIRDIYNQLRTCMRCALSIDYKSLHERNLTFINPGYFPRAYILSNPGGIAHGFIKAEFIDSLEPNTPKQMPPEKGGMLRQFIPAFLEDNTALMQADPHYRDKLLGSGKHVRAMLEGDWSIPDGSALADEWSHVYNEIAPFDIPRNVRIKRCFDWGLSKPFAVTYIWETMNETVTLAGGKSYTFPTGTIIVVGEYYGWNGEPDEGCRKTAKQVGVAIKQYEMVQYWGSQVVPGPSDGSIFNGTSTDKTINDDVVWGYNSHVVEEVPYSKRKKDVLFIPADKTKGSRAKGLILVKSYLEGAHWIEDDSGDVLYPPERPGLIFFKSCKQCIRTLPFIPYDLNDPDDVDTKSEDHLYDTIRYAVLGRTIQFKRLDVQGI